MHLRIELYYPPQDRPSEPLGSALQCTLLGAFGSRPDSQAQVLNPNGTSCPVLSCQGFTADEESANDVRLP